MMIREWAAWMGYQFLYGAAFLGGAGLVPILEPRSPRVREGFPHYLGGLPVPPSGPLIWVHGVSLGESMVAFALLDRLRREFPGLKIGFTTTHPDVLALARKRRLAEVSGYFPLDFAPFVARALSSWRPRAVVIAETDFWPGFSRMCACRQVPLLLVNGRISEKHLAFWTRVPALAGSLFPAFARLGVQSETDRDRLTAMGAGPSTIEVLGNIKFDLVPPLKEDCLGPVRAWRGDDPLVVFGSLHPSEFSALEGVFRDLAGSGSAKILIAPRNVAHALEWEARLRRLSLAVGLRSRPGGLDPANRVLLLDTLGELASLYSLAGSAFVGGTLDPAVGGHNPLEVIAHGVPLVVGPHVRNFADLIASLREAEGVEQIEDPQVLAPLLRQLARRAPRGEAMVERATGVLMANRGALDRSMAMIRPFLADLRPGEPP